MFIWEKYEQIIERQSNEQELWSRNTLCLKKIWLLYVQEGKVCAKGVLFGSKLQITT